MKKLLNFVTTVMLLLMASTINVAATTANSVKTDTTTKMRENIIKYSKMNYKQLETERTNFVNKEQVALAQAFMTLGQSKTDANYKKLCKLADEALIKMLPLQMEVEKRMEKYKDNEEVYNMYKVLHYVISTDIISIESDTKTGGEILKEAKMKEMY